MKIAIMQPYFFPYIGYFQLINAVEQFVIYDDIQFTKKGWINRNRILQNGKDVYVSLPLKKDSDYLSVCERVLADSWPKDRVKLLNKIKGSYSKAPQFKAVFPLIESIILHDNTNLFEFLLNGITQLNDFMGINTKVIVSSTIDFDNELKSADKVQAICKAMNATDYINPIGGLTLYDKEQFQSQGINLNFIKTTDVIYQQFKNDFVPFLSVIDVLMFNPLDDVQTSINCKYQLV